MISMIITEVEKILFGLFVVVKSFTMEKIKISINTEIVFTNGTSIFADFSFLIKRLIIN